MGDLAAAPQMPQAEAVVAVNEDTLAPAAVLHAGSLSSHCGDYGTGQGAAERPSRARPGGPGRALGMFISGRSCSKFAAKRSVRSEEHTSELQALMPISDAVFCL